MARATLAKRIVPELVTFDATGRLTNGDIENFTHWENAYECGVAVGWNEAIDAQEKDTKMADERTPQNAANFLYLRPDISMSEMLESIKAHFGEDVDLNDLTINNEMFHARHIGYDLYDERDYDNYITITRN